MHLPCTHYALTMHLLCTHYARAMCARMYLPLPLTLTLTLTLTLPLTHQVGRASHWETRIMRDDVMSYGTGVALTPALSLTPSYTMTLTQPL